ncbi:MAG: hypothetical protein EOP11_12190 [Proteobacteria bacterium]|nr:MAG: hypothetical protein EOP11_12190 [Pseudomonadota bacterium]
MKLRALQRNEKILLGLILVVLAFLNERAIITGMNERGAAAEVRLTELNKAISDAKAEKELFANRDIASVVSFPPTAALDEAGSASAKVSSFIRELASQESESKFRIVRLGTEDALAGAEYARTPVTLDVEATFPAIGHFLEQLEDGPFLAEVDSLEVYRVENDLRMCAAKIRIYSYAVKP